MAAATTTAAAADAIAHGYYDNIVPVLLWRKNEEFQSQHQSLLPYFDACAPDDVRRIEGFRRM